MKLSSKTNARKLLSSFLESPKSMFLKSVDQRSLLMHHSFQLQVTSRLGHLFLNPFKTLFYFTLHFKVWCIMYHFSRNETLLRLCPYSCQLKSQLMKEFFLFLLGKLCEIFPMSMQLWVSSSVPDIFLFLLPLNAYKIMIFLVPFCFLNLNFSVSISCCKMMQSSITSSRVFLSKVSIIQRLSTKYYLWVFRFFLICGTILLIFCDV